MSLDSHLCSASCAKVLDILTPSHGVWNADSDQAAEQTAQSGGDTTAQFSHLVITKEPPWERMGGREGGMEQSNSKRDLLCLRRIHLGNPRHPSLAAERTVHPGRLFPQTLERCHHQLLLLWLRHHGARRRNNLHREDDLRPLRPLINVIVECRWWCSVGIASGQLSNTSFDMWFSRNVRICTQRSHLSCRRLNMMAFFCIGDWSNLQRSLLCLCHLLRAGIRWRWFIMVDAGRRHRCCCRWRIVRVVTRRLWNVRFLHIGCRCRLLYSLRIIFFFVMDT